MTPKKLVLHTVGGGLDIIYAKDFLPMIKTHEVEGGSKLHIPFQMNYQNSISFEEDLSKIVVGPTIQSRTFDFKQGKYSITAETLEHIKKYGGSISSSVSKISDTLVDIFLEDYDSFNNFKREELNIMVAQKEPEFFIKDLNLETIHKLSSEYYKRCYSGDCYGMHIDLGKYQKFFAIVNSEDFTFYRTKPKAIQEFGMDQISIKWLGRLINLKPQNWVVGRYENLVYLNEMNSMNNKRYVPLTGEGGDV